MFKDSSEGQTHYDETAELIARMAAVVPLAAKAANEAQREMMGLDDPWWQDEKYWIELNEGLGLSALPRITDIIVEAVRRRDEEIRGMIEEICPKKHGGCSLCQIKNILHRLTPKEPKP
jgi:methionine synthase II (cobalamin-independent)